MTEPNSLDYVTLSPTEIEKLLGAGNGEAALVLLYMRATGDVSLQEAEKRLRIPMQNLSWAKTLLQRLDLLNTEVNRTQYAPEYAPVYSSDAVSSFSAQDSSFLPMQQEIANRLGRPLSTEDMRTLIALRDYLKLPPEVVIMALTCCIQKCEYASRASGNQRSVSIRMLERECYEWANLGIDTLQKASEHISRSLEQADPVGRVRRAIGLDRAFIPAEKEFVESWLKLGFPVESIRVAYERTVMRTGKLTWSYMNRILQNWHEKNLHTPEEISGGDRQQAATTAQPAFQPGEQERAAVSSLQNYLDSLKG